MGIGIAILAFLVIFTGIQTFYPAPEYDDYCGDERTPIPAKIGEPVACTEDAKECPDGSFVSRDPTNDCEFFPCDDKFTTCHQEFDSVDKVYSKNLFIITLIIGIILLALGGALFELEAVGAGLMGGGIISLIYGSGRYWQYAGDLFRFIISIVGLILVIGLAYYLNKKKK